MSTKSVLSFGENSQRTRKKGSMKISTHLTGIMVAIGKRVDPASCFKADVIARIWGIYGLIAI